MHYKIIAGIKYVDLSIIIVSFILFSEIWKISSDNSSYWGLFTFDIDCFLSQFQLVVLLSSHAYVKRFILWFILVYHPSTLQWSEISLHYLSSTIHRPNYKSGFYYELSSLIESKYELLLLLRNSQLPD